MPKKIPEVVLKRLYLNSYVCMKCNAKTKSTRDKVIRGKTKCRKCGSKELRLKAKERRGSSA
jgi:ribosomal protein L40E